MGEPVRGCRWLALALSTVAATPAWAQGQGDITAAVGLQLDAYTLCLKQQAHDLAKSVGTEDEILAKVIVACHAERKDLWLHLQMPPLNASREAATEAVQQLSTAMYPAMLNAIQAGRGS
jgi:hypothetical protein